MSFFSPPPPDEDPFNGANNFAQKQMNEATKNFTGIIAIVIVANLVLLGIIVAVCWYCVKKSRKALPEILSEVKIATATTSRQPQHVVPIWEVDAPTMEKFLQELAKDKPDSFNEAKLKTSPRCGTAPSPL
ncbi:hypothetical protein SLEP1_g59847 [Rubroshorea leprosula]|uniref:Uncharacterized protein n=1 Tax=Rubroshorea leprosula TaxID=152421 RepID=A0AAV5MUV9_9ROSI|nr:hypothetical protein SLEP1_g59847 [Rubroshorea leprosula]